MKTDARLDRDTGALYDALSELIKVYQFRDRERTNCHGISVTECYALEALDRDGPLTLNELAGHLYLDKSTVSRAVDGMERKGLLTRLPHAGDRRAVQLEVTSRGRGLHERIVGEAEDRYRGLIADTDPQIRLAFVELLHRIAHAARASGKGAPCPDEASH
jgi:DNA-binding MarR family transcriptional regulator